MMPETHLHANEASWRKLQSNKLRRLAKKRGLTLRKSDYGYSLVDGFRNRVADRNDLTLREVEEHLSQAQDA
jgi:hypothetical protein